MLLVGIGEKILVVCLAKCSMKLIARNAREFRLHEDTLKTKLNKNISQVEKEVNNAFLRDQIFHICV